MDDRSIPPEHLYKYRSALPDKGKTPIEEWRSQLERHRSPIVNSQLFFPPPSALNDPFDCAPNWDLDATAVDVDALGEIGRQRVMNPEFWREAWKDQVDKFGVYALSKDPEHPLMWAHYGGNHAGYCLEFALSDITLAQSDHDLVPLPVSYSSKRPTTKTSDWIRAMRSRAVLEQELFAILCHKDVHWEYEEEWRLISRKGGVSKPVPPKILTALILGTRCSPGDEACLRDWAGKRSPSLAIRRAVPSLVDYSIKIEDATEYLR